MAGMTCSVFGSDRGKVWAAVRLGWITAAKVVAGIAFLGIQLAATSVTAQVTSWPTFNSVGSCAENEPANDEDPATSDLVGTTGASAAFIAADSNFLYLRERVGRNPGNPGSLVNISWVVLVQTASGNP